MHPACRASCLPACARGEPARRDGLWIQLQAVAKMPRLPAGSGQAYLPSRPDMAQLAHPPCPTDVQAAAGRRQAQAAHKAGAGAQGGAQRRQRRRRRQQQRRRQRQRGGQAG